MLPELGGTHNDLSDQVAESTYLPNKGHDEAAKEAYAGDSGGGRHANRLFGAWSNVVSKIPLSF
jgi:hypothetical protein